MPTEKNPLEGLNIEKLNKLICILADYFEDKRLRESAREALLKEALEFVKAPEKKEPKADITSSEMIEKIGKSWKIYNDSGEVAFIGASLVEEVNGKELYLKEGSKWVANKIKWEKKKQ